MKPELDAGWGTGWEQGMGVGGALTVDTVVRQCTLRCLAGDVNYGPWGAPSFQAPGHHLESQRDYEWEEGPVQSCSLDPGSAWLAAVLT